MSAALPPPARPSAIRSWRDAAILLIPVVPLVAYVLVRAAFLTCMAQTRDAERCLAYDHSPIVVLGWLPILDLSARSSPASWRPFPGPLAFAYGVSTGWLFLVVAHILLLIYAGACVLIRPAVFGRMTANLASVSSGAPTGKFALGLLLVTGSWIVFTYIAYSGAGIGAGSRALYHSLTGLMIVDLTFAVSYLMATTMLFFVFVLASTLTHRAAT